MRYKLTGDTRVACSRAYKWSSIISGLVDIENPNCFHNRLLPLEGQEGKRKFILVPANAIHLLRRPKNMAVFDK